MSDVENVLDEEEYLRVDSELRNEGAHSLYGFLNRRGLDPTKLACNPCRPHGQLKLTASAFIEYASSPGHRAYCYAGLAVSSPAVAETTAGTQCTCPQKDSQAEWA